VVSPAVLFETENPGYNFNKQKRKHLVCEGCPPGAAFHMASVFAQVEHPNPYVPRHALLDCAWVPVGSILQSQHWMSCPLTAEYRPGTKLQRKGQRGRFLLNSKTELYPTLSASVCVVGGWIEF